MPSTARHWSLLWAHLGVLACSGVAPIPDTPDLTELQARYDHPTAVLDATSIEDTIRRVPNFEDLAVGLRATHYAIEGLDRAGESIGDRKAEGIRIQGTVDVGLRCPGMLGSQDDEVNGTLSLTIGVAESRIRRGVHGVARHCVLRGERTRTPLRVEVEGPVDFDLGRDLPIGERWAGRLLAVVAGSITIEGVAFRNVCARFTSELLEFLYERQDGTTVVFQLTDEGLALRDAEQIWICPDGQPCRFD
jgi:hypothetical protein